MYVYLFSFSLTLSSFFLANKCQIEHRFRFNGFRSTSFLSFYCVRCGMCDARDCLLMFSQRCAYFRHMFPSHFLSKCSWFSVFIPTIPVLLLLFFPTVITLVCSNCEFSRRRRRHLSVSYRAGHPSLLQSCYVIFAFILWVCVCACMFVPPLSATFFSRCCFLERVFISCCHGY